MQKGFGRIRDQLLVIGAIFSVGLLAVGGIGVYSSSRLSGDLENVVEKSIPLVRNLTLVDMAHDGLRGVVLEAVLGASERDAKRIASAKEGVEDHAKNVQAEFAIITKVANAELKEPIAKAMKDVDAYIAAAHEVIALTEKGDRTAILAGFDKFQQQFEALEESLGAVGELSEQTNTTVFAAALSGARRMRATSIAIFALALFFGIAGSFMVARRLTKSLGSITAMLNHNAEGAGAAVTQLAKASDDLSSASSEQAAALQETAAAIDEISAMVRNTAENASEAEKTSESSKQKAERGQSILNQMVDSMDAVSKSNDKIAQQMSETSERTAQILQVIQDIVSKTKVINDIVFQTKLLSFNASVEAARAGEHGKGFAVVAEEVGNLAQMSGNAAKEISEMLELSTGNVRSIVEQTNSRATELVANAKATVARGVQITEECSQVLSEIVKSSSEVSSMVTRISEANNNQSKGVEEISKAIHQLEHATQVNSTASRACADSSAKLSEQMTDLRSAASQLGEMVVGAAKQAEEAAAFDAATSEQSDEVAKAA